MKRATKAQQALAFVQDAAKKTKSWVALSNAFYGIGGKFVELFPTKEERTAFRQTPEAKEIDAIIESLQSEGDDQVPNASGRFVLRLPKSIHAALIAEADAEGVSLNQLCLSKLSVQLRALV